MIWRASQLFPKLHSYSSVLWRFCSISVLSEFSYLGIGLKTKTWTSRKIFILQGFFLRLYQIFFCVSLTLFLFAEFVIPLFNCYFRDFRGFCDFQVFHLVVFLWVLINIWAIFEDTLQNTCFLSFVFDSFWLQKQPLAEILHIWCS